MVAGTLSLSFSLPGNFVATVTAPPSFSVMSANLTSPTGTPYPMTNTGGGNPSTWQHAFSGGVSSGTWTATAMLQAMAQCSGSTTA